AAMAEKRIEPTASALDLVQQCFDELHRMRDRIEAGHRVASADELVARLEALCSDRGAAASQAPAAETARSAAPAAPSAPEAARPQAPDRPQVGAADEGRLPAVEELVSEPLEPGDTVIEPRGFGPVVDDEAPQAAPPVAESPEAADEPLDEAVEVAGQTEERTETSADVGDIALAIEAPVHDDAPTPEASLAPEEATTPLDAPAPAAVPVAADARGAERAETTRVDAGLLDALLASAGEISIFQSRLNQHLPSNDFHLGELAQTVTRLREQLRKLEAETEAQILYRHQDDLTAGGDFDPLELDRYSTIQQLSRALAETANDVASINELLQGLTTEAETLLGQQARVTSEIQEGLMQTRMVPFQRHVSRLARIVRQAAGDTGKLAELVVHGGS